MNKKFLMTVVISFFIFTNSASAAILPSSDIIAPDSPFYFLQTWKESIQTFFTFGAENKAKQYLHLAEVRLNEYQNLIDKGKTEIAEKTLAKYEKQLDNALQKTEELKNKGKDIKDLSQKIEETVSKHLEVLQENLQKVPEQAKKGIENAIENSQKQMEKITGKKPRACTEEAKVCPDGTAVGRTGPNCEFAACPEAKTDETADQSQKEKEKAQSSITVLSPDGGEVWKIRSIQKISWQIFNQPAKSWVSLSLEKDDGKVFSILGGYTGNSTNWTVSQDLPEDLPIGNDYKIKACLYQNIIKCFTTPCPANRSLSCDSSDAAFSIVAAENQ